MAHGTQRCIQTYRRQDILKGPTAASMHVHVARGNSREIQCLAQRLEKRQTTCIETPGQQLHTHPQTPAETLAQPTPILFVVRPRCFP